METTTLLGIVFGVAFVLFILRFLRSPIKEVLFFSSFFGLMEAWRTYGAEINLPSIPHFLVVFFVTGLITWGVVSLVNVLAQIFPPLAIVSNLLKVGGK